MARTALTLYTPARDGTTITWIAATADGEAFDNTGENVVLYVKNGDAASKDVTIQTPGTVDTKEIPELIVTVPANEDRIIGPFPKEVYNKDDSGGDTEIEKAVFINTSAQTNVTLAAIKMGSLAF